jgi:CRISPR/Cas system-associated protein Cas10 (large subunit of type III CRISPR-Cas system)
LEAFAFPASLSFGGGQFAVCDGMRVCSTCRLEKALDEFSQKGSALQSKCKSCQRAYHRNYYRENKSRFITKNRRNKNRQRRRLRAILLDVKRRPCQDCGGSFHPWVMELDHRDGTTKTAAVANLVSKGCTDARLLEEIEKCDVVCANCHRMRTYRRMYDKESVPV